MSTRVLIIGGTRFLGLTIAKPFISKGYDVYEMNRGTRPSADGVIEQIVCDKADRAAFTKVLKRWRWDIVIDTILTDEDLEFVVTTLGSDVGHFIHTGSLGVYGAAVHIPALESQPLQESHGDDIVFNNKIKQDQVIIRAFQEHGFPGTIMRMSYIYGPGDKLLDGWGGRSSEFFKLVQDGETVPIPVDGRALLHPGHVSDLGRAFLHAAERPVSIGQIYNVGGNHALMMKDYVAKVADALGVEPKMKFVPMREILDQFPKITSERGMMFACQHMCASIAKADVELDWRPEISLEAGLRENVEWMKSQGMLTSD